ncbi:M23 family metallopeptidase [Paenibacillus sp. YPG26]|uniref:M23 family metallopeptidase n=1 Tax=Paenibacillus sp. YPG26 TaxID=2878915 RepID=UPI00203FB972|nr:M23 family metallopeptidase [Paenibacillus sp. YPG26]USB34256.1 M23 family metallopeptidase [Paenibacillus sp. YPG26]
MKKRREERIGQLLAAPMDHSMLGKPLWEASEHPSSYEIQEPVIETNRTHVPEYQEPDPERVWKQNSARWAYDIETNSRDSRDPKDSGRGNPPGTVSFWKMLFLRALISSMIFGALWGIYRYEPEWSLPIRQFVDKTFTEEIDFGAAQVWYNEHFGGAPSFIPIFGQNKDKGQKVQSQQIFFSPMEGTVILPFALNLEGIEVLPPAAKLKSGESQVSSVETGRVTEVTQDVNTGLTVHIQHPGGYYSIYGHLSSANVQQGDWVEGGEAVGSLRSPEAGTPKALYFALKKDGQYIDPSDVVPFD